MEDMQDLTIKIEETTYRTSLTPWIPCKNSEFTMANLE